MDSTLKQIFNELISATIEGDRLRARVSELERLLAEREAAVNGATVLPD